MQLPDYYEFFSRSKINSGKKAMEHLPFELNDLNAKKPLVITCVNSAREGLPEKLVKAFYDSDIVIGAIFDKVGRDASVGLVNDLAELYAYRGCDSIIALSGGAVMNIAKGVNIAVSLKDDVLKFSEEGAINTPLKPLVALPTKYSTGLETSNKAIIDNHLFSSDFLFPDLVVIDSRLTRPGNAETAVEGAMIALTHCIEANTDEFSSPVNDSYAYGAIQFINENLYRVVKKPSHKEGSIALANAATMASIVFSNSPAGIVHLLSEELSRITGVSLGKCMGILLPYALEYKRHKKQRIRPELLLALAGFDGYSETPEQDRANKAVNKIRGMQQNLKDFVPGSLKEINVPLYKLEQVAAAVVEKSSGRANLKECMTLLETALEGQILV